MPKLIRAVTEAEILVAGEKDNFVNPGLRYNITSPPQPGMSGRTQEVIVGAALGGSSAINGMVYVRGTKEEYDGWKVLGGRGSTWEWSKMLPYFKKASTVRVIPTFRLEEYICR
jgi:choline dehydrogenase-like flavoprotein